MNENFLVNGYHASTNYNSTFIKIFEQNYNGKRENLFKDDNEANFSLKKNKFSVLKYIDQSFLTRASNAYELIIYYKEIDMILHWSQKWNFHQIPVDESIEKLHVNESIKSLTGLAPSQNATSDSFIDGEAYKNDWWYCIGMKKTFTNKEKESGIPGPIVDNKCIVVNSVSLWIKIDDITLLKKLPNIKKKCSFAKPMHMMNKIITMMILISRS